MSVSERRSLDVGRSSAMKRRSSGGRWRSGECGDCCLVLELVLRRGRVGTVDSSGAISEAETTASLSGGCSELGNGGDGRASFSRYRLPAWVIFSHDI